MGTKISALTEVTGPNNTDVLPIVNSATTKKVQIQNIVEAAAAIWARVYHNADQSITTATNTVLAFNSERADTDVIHDTVTANSRLTCKTAGVYSIHASVQFAANATGTRHLGLRLNGTTSLVFQRGVSPGGALPALITVSTLYAMAVNDYVEVIVYQDSGGALNVQTDPNHSPEFMMARLGA